MFQDLGKQYHLVGTQLERRMETFSYSVSVGHVELKKVFTSITNSGSRDVNKATINGATDRNC